jgi:asparagine synthase (glutamine-hydrolysing)
MCGISGLFYYNDEKVQSELIESINDTLKHRGPDAGATKVFGNVALGHRRLSIIDLSDNANQPMSTSDGRYTIVFNGEIYNFPEIKEILIQKQVIFLTCSDTEVILKAYEFYGTSCLSMFNGMFAFAIYDLLKEELFLARDQFGIKPLYYSSKKELFIFASEMKAILKHPKLDFSLNKQALVEYIWFENALGENTFYNEIKELKPGSYLVISHKGIEERIYFDINDIKEKTITEKEAIQKISCLLEESVKRHLISDVPVGVFLSGGIDSSAITAFASKHYKGKLKTFSVAFDYDNGNNELQLAKEIADKFETEHHEIQISGNDIIDVIEDLVKAHDEPFGDAADIPLFLLTRKLKGSVKVVLQGDGGDEFFGGYSRYNTISNANKWSKLSFLSNLISLSRTRNPKALRLQRFLSAISQKEAYKRNALLLTMESRFSNPFRIFNKHFLTSLEGLDPFKKFKEVYSQYRIGMEPAQELFYTDTQTILKDTYFEKVDKSTMANSMEVRVPFIDKELAEFALSIPSSLKARQGEQKYLLKKALSGIIPDKVLYGKKKGFGVPYAYWLRTSLSDYFLKQISTQEVAKYLNRKEICRMFDVHKKGKGNFGFLLWKTMIFCIWINNNSKINKQVVNENTVFQNTLSKK